MYNIWPLVIILICLFIIISLIIRRFPALALLDVDNIPEEKEQQIKERIMKSRIKRNFTKVDRFWAKFSIQISKVYKLTWEKLENFKKRQEKKISIKSTSDVSSEDKIAKLFEEADVLIKSDQFKTAEQKLIDIIEIDDKNLKAFKELGELYYKESKMQEAKQTLLYALKLAESNKEYSIESDLNYTLSMISKDLNDLEGSILFALNALNREPNNPRFLDWILDLCIIKKDRSLALEYLQRIKDVNPDNQNIEEWERQIASL